MCILLNLFNKSAIYYLATATKYELVWKKIIIRISYFFL